MSEEITQNREPAKLLVLDDFGNFPGIKDYSCTLEDIDSENTQRDETGRLHREPLRQNVIKLAVSAILTTEQLFDVSDTLSKPTFKADVFAPLHPEASSGYASGEFYVSKKTQQLLSFNQGYWTLTFNAIEV